MIEKLPIDIVKTVVVDIMCAGYLGVTKQFSKLIIRDRKKDYSVPLDDIETISKDILLIGPQVTRRI